jgi:DNA-binding Lrp family transcriptional regulator
LRVVIIITKAYILINTGLNDDNEVFTSLKNISDVKEAYRLNGVYDILAIVESENTEKLKNTISRRIRRIPQVRTTISLLESKF